MHCAMCVTYMSLLFVCLQMMVNMSVDVISIENMLTVAATGTQIAVIIETTPLTGEGEYFPITVVS